MGQTDVFDLPWPELGDLADGPDGYEDLARATEAALIGLKPTVFEQSFGSQTFQPNVFRNFQINTFPTGKLFVGSVMAAGVRITGAQWINMSVNDTNTLLSGVNPATLSTIGTQLIFNMTIPIAHLFTGIFAVNFYCSNGPAVIIDNISAVGVVY